jgi:hypothetical protein
MVIPPSWDDKWSDYSAVYCFACFHCTLQDRIRKDAETSTTQGVVDIVTLYFKGKTEDLKHTEFYDLRKQHETVEAVNTKYSRLRKSESARDGEVGWRTAL